MHTKTQMSLSVITFIALIGLAVAMPILDPIPYDPTMDTLDMVDSDEDITCLNFQDCMDMFGMKRENPETNLKEKPRNPCVVICDNLDRVHLDRCNIPFTILSSISSEVVANYSMHEMLLITQYRRYVDLVIRSYDPNEYKVPYTVMETVLQQTISHMLAMSEIIHSVEHYLGEIELDTECSGILDMWMGYRVLKMAGIL